MKTIKLSTILVLLVFLLTISVADVFGAYFSTDCTSINCDGINQAMSNGDVWEVTLSPSCKARVDATNNGAVTFTKLHNQTFLNNPSDIYNGNIVNLNVSQSYVVAVTNGNFIKKLVCDKNLIATNNLYLNSISWYSSDGSSNWKPEHNLSVVLTTGSPIEDFVVAGYSPIQTISEIYNVSLSYIPPNIIINLTNNNQPIILVSNNQTFFINTTSNFFDNSIYNMMFNNTNVNLNYLNNSNYNNFNILINNTINNNETININIQDNTTYLNTFNTDYNLSWILYNNNSFYETFNNAFGFNFTFEFGFLDNSTEITYNNDYNNISFIYTDNSSEQIWVYSDTYNQFNMSVNNNITNLNYNNLSIWNYIGLNSTQFTYFNNSFLIQYTDNGTKIWNTTFVTYSTLNSSLVCESDTVNVAPASCASPIVTNPINIFVNGSSGNAGVQEVPRVPLTKEETVFYIILAILFGLIALITGWRYTRKDKPSNGFSLFKKKLKDEVPIPDSLYDKMNREIENVPRPITPPTRVR